MAEKQPWKTREDVRRLVVSDKQIEDGAYGEVFLGRLYFHGKKQPTRVGSEKIFSGYWN